MTGETYLHRQKFTPGNALSITSKLLYFLWVIFVLKHLPFQGLAAVLYVSQNAQNPVLPYTNWATAALTIQDAVDAASPGDEILVTNGLYVTGGRALPNSTKNRVLVDKTVSIRSINGPEVTLIHGYPVTGNTAIRCAYLSDGASLSGFTLINGATRLDETGGGIWCGTSNVVVSNCVITANSASAGGGSWYGNLLSCTLQGNRANNGGGCFGSKLESCLVVSNTATEGGGAFLGTLSNCTLRGNSAVFGGGSASAQLINCLITSNLAWHGGGEQQELSCGIASSRVITPRKGAALPITQ